METKVNRRFSIRNLACVGNVKIMCDKIVVTKRRCVEMLRNSIMHSQVSQTCFPCARRFSRKWQRCRIRRKTKSCKPKIRTKKRRRKKKRKRRTRKRRRIRRMIWEEGKEEKRREKRDEKSHDKRHDKSHDKSLDTGGSKSR